MAKFKYGDRVRVAHEDHADFGKTGRVVERVPDNTPWVTLDEASAEPYGSTTPPIGVFASDYSDTSTTALSEDSLERVPTTVATTAGEVPMGGMFTTAKEGGKFIRINTNYVDGERVVDGEIATLVMEPLKSSSAVGQWETTSWDEDDEVEMFV